MNTEKQSLYFDPDNYPDDTLKAFLDFVQDFEHRYVAAYPDPPQVSVSAAVERWKVAPVLEALRRLYAS